MEPWDYSDAPISRIERLPWRRSRMSGWGDTRSGVGQFIRRTAAAHLHQESGLTVLLVTHDINMIRARVDRLTLLKTRLYAAGPPTDVLKANILREVYGKDLVITDKDLIIVED